MQKNNRTILRGWVPWLRSELVRSVGTSQPMPRKLTAFNCSPGLLSATSDDLAKLVSRGIKDGHLRLET